MIAPEVAALMGPEQPTEAPQGVASKARAQGGSQAAAEPRGAAETGRQGAFRATKRPFAGEKTMKNHGKTMKNDGFLGENTTNTC